MYLKYKKLGPNSKEPVRANPSDAGLDLFFCPPVLQKQISGNFVRQTWGGVSIKEKEKEYKIKEMPILVGQQEQVIKHKQISLLPGENAILPSGVSIEIPHGFVGMVCNRSSVAAKNGLLCGAHIVDAGYSGEIFVDLHNVGMEEKTLTEGDKIAQILLLPVMGFSLIEDKHLYEKECVISNRKDGALGSTDEKKEGQK